MPESLLLFAMLLFAGIFLSFAIPVHAQGGKSLAQFKLPAENSSGLIDINIEYEPVIRIDQIGNTASVLLNMNVVLSRATAIKGNFWYRYWYEGEQYTDVQVGRDVFVPIDLANMTLSLTIMGPNALIETVEWKRSMQNQIVLKVQGKPQASDFKVFIKGLEYVAFRGDEAIKRAILNLKAAELKKADDAKKREADKLAADRKVTDEKPGADRLVPDNLKKEQAAGWNTRSATSPGTATTTKGSGKGGDDGFWDEKKTTPATHTANMPEIAMSTDGKYYRKGFDGKYQQIGYDEYQSIKQSKAQQKNKQTEADAQAKREADQKTLDATMARIKADQQRQEAFTKDLVNRTNQFGQALTMGAKVEDSKRELKENSNMQGNYESVDQLMADFNQKMASINSTVATLNEQRNAYVNSMSDAMYSDPGEEAFNQGAKLIGGIINSAKQAKEKKEAQARLKAQKDAALTRFKLEEAKMLTGIRTDLYQRFKEGSLPLSSTKVQANTIYYFAYAYNPAQLGSKQTTLYISNVFAIDRYSDGTWPFKNSIVNDLSKLTPYNEVLHGYYLSKEEAESMRNGMMDIFVKTGGSTTAFAYKGKASSGGSKGGSTDFWETGAKPASDSTSKEKKAVKKDDFWSN